MEDHVKSIINDHWRWQNKFLLLFLFILVTIDILPESNNTLVLAIQENDDMMKMRKNAPTVLEETVTIATKEEEQQPQQQEQEPEVEIDPEPSHTYIQADAMYEYPLVHSTNHFHRIMRHLSKETGLYQQTLLFYAAVSTTGKDESFYTMLLQHYCAQYGGQVVGGDCQSTVNMIISDYEEHCKAHNNTLQISYSKATIIDIGFQKRMNIRNERLSLAKQRKEENVHDLTFRDVFATKVSSNERVSSCCRGSNCGGDLAVLVTGYWEILASSSHRYRHNSTQTTPSTEDVNNIHSVHSQPSHSPHLDGTSNHQQDNPNNNPYLDWFDRSLKINMPYVLFTDSQSFTNLMLKRNTGFPTLFVSHEMNSFHVKDSNLIPDEWTVENKHVPSRALSKIWLEKMNLVYLASQIEKDALFYVWIDAGLSTYREVMPPSEEWSHEALLSLPKDRISYCRVEGEYHSFGAGVIVFPRSMVRIGHFLFYKLYEMCMEEVNDWKCGSDQYIWTQVLLGYPELFHAMSYDYGDIEFLWGSVSHRVAL